MAVKPLRGLIRRDASETDAPLQERRRDPYEEMDRWFTEVFNRPLFGYPRFSGLRLSDLRMPWSEELSPDVDIYEEEKEVVIKAELPGMKKEDIDINITDDVVTISGEKKSEEKVEKKNYYRLERAFGSFTRRLHLPVATITDKAKAAFKDGILEIRIPKSEETRDQVKNIKVE